MGGSSSSSTTREYTTMNTSQQGEANAYGENNVVQVERADAVTLDNIAAMLAEGVGDLSESGRDVTEAGVRQTEKSIEEGNRTARRSVEEVAGVNRDSLDFAEGVNADSLNLAEWVNADSLDFAEGVNADALDLSGDALDNMTGLALEVAQGAENSSQQAMDFADNFTEREQIGSQGDALRTLTWVAGATAVALIGVAWASKGGMK